MGEARDPIDRCEQVLAESNRILRRMVTLAHRGRQLRDRRTASRAQAANRPWRMLPASVPHGGVSCTPAGGLSFVTLRLGLRDDGRFAELLPEFETTRTRTREFVAAANGDLRRYFYPHPLFGLIDCYQWLEIGRAHV